MRQASIRVLAAICRFLSLVTPAVFARKCLSNTNPLNDHSFSAIVATAFRLGAAVDGAVLRATAAATAIRIDGAARRRKRYNLVAVVHGLDGDTVALLHPLSPSPLRQVDTERPDVRAERRTTVVRAARGGVDLFLRPQRQLTHAESVVHTDGALRRRIRVGIQEYRWGRPESLVVQLHLDPAAVHLRRFSANGINTVVNT